MFNSKEYNVIPGNVSLTNQMACNYRSRKEIIRECECGCRRKQMARVALLGCLKK